MKSYVLSAALLCCGFVAYAGDQVVKNPPAVYVGQDAPSQCDADPDNLVANCGFETGRFAPEWIQGGDMSFTAVTAFAHSGMWGTDFGPTVGQGTITQNLPTTAGGLYTLTFWLANDGGAPGNCRVYWDGGLVFESTDPAPLPYTQITITDLQASTDGTDLQFSFLQVPAWWHLDDIDVVAQ